MRKFARSEGMEESGWKAPDGRVKEVGLIRREDKFLARGNCFHGYGSGVAVTGY